MLMGAVPADHISAARSSFDTIFAGATQDFRAISLAETQRRAMRRVTESHDLTAGSISFEAMHTGLAAAHPPPHGVFVDLGSGVGCGVIAAALLFGWSKCIGVELLEDLHNAALTAAERFESLRRDLDRNTMLLQQRLIAREVEFRCGDLFDLCLRGVDVVFCCCCSWAHDIMFRLARKLADELADGAGVLTVGRPLPHKVELGANTITFKEIWHDMTTLDWGREVLVLHRVVHSSTRSQAPHLSPMPVVAVGIRQKRRECTLS